jgi:hypothetical protein
MTHKQIDALLDKALGVLTAMRVADFEAMSITIDSLNLSDNSAHVAFAPKLKLVRTAALQAAQLLSLRLPDSIHTNTYAPESLATAPAYGSEFSIIG